MLPAKADYKFPSLAELTWREAQLVLDRATVAYCEAVDSREYCLAQLAEEAENLARWLIANPSSQLLVRNRLLTSASAVRAASIMCRRVEQALGIHVP